MYAVRHIGIGYPSAQQVCCKRSVCTQWSLPDDQAQSTGLPCPPNARGATSLRTLRCCAWPFCFPQFFQQLGRCGLTCTEVREPGLPTPPPSPPPLTDLFPEMRIAVYDIRLGEEAVGVEGLGSGGAA